MQSNKKEPKSLSVGIWRQMFPFFRPYRKEFATTFGLNILLILVDVAVPLFQSYAIDHFIVPDTLHGIWLFAIAYAGVIIMQMVCVFFSVRAAITIEMNVGRDMKRAQFVHLQKLSFSYYNTTPVGYIHARVMSDTSKIASVIAWGLVDMFGGGFFTTMLKHSKMDQAKRNMEQAKYDLRNFSRELNDVNMVCNLNIDTGDFLSFADYFFDGFVVDWVVQDRINNAKRQVEEAIRRTESIVNQLQRM